MATRSAPFVQGSDTSEAAAQSIALDLPRMEAIVLAVIQRAGVHGRTSDEIEVEAGLSHQTASARVRGLVLRGFVVDSGFRRLTRSGRRAAVWITTSRGSGR